jgi:putative SOS response-associated peptidase YedK
MCTRDVFTDPAEAIRDLFKITAPLPNWPPNYNVAPTQIIPVVRPIDGGREIAMMEWGLRMECAPGTHSSVVQQVGHALIGI